MSQNLSSHEKVERLFERAIQAPAAQRKRVIDESEFEGDIKEKVFRMLKADASATRVFSNNIFSDVSNLEEEFFEADVNSAYTSALEENEFSNGQIFENYRIDSKLGDGGMSIVYKATQTSPLSREVALKFIRTDRITDQLAGRFQREQQALALLNHPNIATFLESGKTTKTGKSRLYSVMEFIDGCHIDAFCNNRPIPWSLRIRLIIQVCDALSCVHRHNIIHRDIKPSNILITGQHDKGKAATNSKDGSLPNVAKLIDFGIAKVDTQRENFEFTQTQHGQLLGSPRYMSPEQLSGNEVDHRTDIYSLGLVLFELLRGRPFRQDSAHPSLLPSQEFDPWAALVSGRKTVSIGSGKGASSAVHPTSRPETCASNSMSADVHCDLPTRARKNLDWVLSKCLNPEPRLRYESTEELKNDLIAILDGYEIGAGRPPISYRLKTISQNHKRSLIVLAIVSVAAVIGWTTYKFWQNEQQLHKVESASKSVNQNRIAANDLLLGMIASPEFNLDDRRLDLSTLESYENQRAQIRQRGGPVDHDDRTIYAILAAMYAKSDQFSDSDVALLLACHGDSRPELKNIKSKVGAKFKESFDVSFHQPLESIERARLSLFRGRCLIMQGNDNEAEPHILAAHRTFQELDPDSLDCFSASVTLVQVFGKLEKYRKRRELAENTLLQFKDKYELLRTETGYCHFAILIENLHQRRTATYDRIFREVRSNNFLTFEFDKIDEMLPFLIKENQGK